MCSARQELPFGLGEPSIYRSQERRGSVFSSYPQRKIQKLFSPITKLPPSITQLLLDILDQMEIHPAEMSEGKKDYETFINCLTSKIREGAQEAESLSSACIYRVPKEIRTVNESAYTPRLIAIGPLHRNDPHLQTPMRHVKTSYMNNLLCRMTQGMENQEAEQKKILQECVAAIEMSIEDAKKCYAEEVKLDVEMMLVDGCFILEFLYKFFLWNIDHPQFKRQGLETADPILGTMLTRRNIQHDLLFLENQIPFLVLERLFKLTLARIPDNPLEKLSLTDYVFLPKVDQRMRPREGNSTNSGSRKTSCSPRDCVLWVLDSKPKEEVSSEEEEDDEEEVSSRNANYYRHILHKLHYNLHPHDQAGKGDILQRMPCASELLYAGVKFVSGTGNDMFQVKFTEPEGPFWWCRSAHFEIPSLEVADSTEPILRNFIAFEHCCPGISQHFTSYATLMDMLVNSDMDVQVLQKAGVMDNWLGASEDVTDLFNKLCIGNIIGDQFLFGDVCNRATSYSKRCWPKNMAYLRRQYFASPWKFIAFCLGFVYFGLTIAQLIVSIYIK